jgi:hypothetical protein
MSGVPICIQKLTSFRVKPLPPSSGQLQILDNSQATGHTKCPQKSRSGICESSPASIKFIKYRDPENQSCTEF